MKEYGHTPVMAERMVALLAPALTKNSTSASRSVLIDCTLGAGGHAELFLTQFPNIEVIGIDRDRMALTLAAERLAKFSARFTAVHARYDQISQVLSDQNLTSVAGVLFDLGVSSMQLDQAERGFAYAQDAPLDMRMDNTESLTAAMILNTYSHGEIARILSVYGEERFAGKIASAILRERERAPFVTSGRLVELLYATIPAATRRTGGHPAKRTFQALRIEVNRELAVLTEALPAALASLAVGGRAAVMSYQSLEDRIVKQLFATRIKSTNPAGLPVDLPGTEPNFSIITRGAEQADEKEIASNPRAASVRVRVIERVLAERGDKK